MGRRLWMELAARTVDRVAALAEGKVIAIGPLDYLRKHATGWLAEYFGGPRGRAALG